MTFTALAHVLVMLFATLHILVVWLWPRDRDGRMWTDQEVERWLQERGLMPKRPPTIVEQFAMLFLLALATGGIAASIK